MPPEAIGSMEFDADVVVIGAGVLGCAIARELTRYDCETVVLERFSDVGEGSSKANSGLIHAGFHPRENSLKGVSCVQGNALYDRLADELGIPIKRTGSLYVAFGENGIERLREKHARGLANGAVGLEVIDGDRARSIEPRLSKRVVMALWAPTTALVSPFALVEALARSVVHNCGRFEFERTVRDIKRIRGGWSLCCDEGFEMKTRFVVNAAGDSAEELDALVHPADLVVRPRRGQYIVFDKQSIDHGIKHPVMQSQESDEKGILVTPTIEGNLLLGPTSENVRGFSHTETTSEGIAHLIEVGKRLFPDLDIDSSIAQFGGVRANIANVDKEAKDFIVRASAPGFISTLGIKNPGMTSAPALARLVIELLRAEGLRLQEDASFNPRLAPRTPFLQKNAEEQRALFDRDARCARIVCRCEGVTESDVRAVVNDVLPPKTINGVKRRLRCGMGRCQGSFCTSRIVDVLADEWGVSPDEVKLGEQGGSVVRGRVK